MSAWGAGGRGFESHRPHFYNGFTYHLGWARQQYYGNLLPERASQQKECKDPMPAKLTTTVSKIAQVPNKINSSFLKLLLCAILLNYTICSSHKERLCFSCISRLDIVAEDQTLLRSQINSPHIARTKVSSKGSAYPAFQPLNHIDRQILAVFLYSHGVSGF